MSREELLRDRNELLDCGQDGVCACPGGHGGCLRHWEERNRELGTEVVALRARVAELEKERAKSWTFISEALDAYNDGDGEGCAKRLRWFLK